MVVIYLVAAVFIVKPSPNDVAYKDKNSNVFGLNIPHNLEFCGEKIPSNNFNIKEDLEKEFFTNNYWKNNSLVLFNKARRWFPYIEPILKAEGVPDDFKYLCVIESHLSNASSPAGAAGFWQLVPNSARNYGLEVSDEVDERYHIEKSTHAACSHVKDAYRMFKNWTLSAAAYNLGIGGIQNAMRKQGSDNYYDLMLNSETGSFIYRILAYKTLFASPEHFGIKNKKWNYFSKIPVSLVKVDSTVSNISHLAIYLGTDVKTLKLFNPWLLKNTLTNVDKKPYVFLIPKNSKTDYSYLAEDVLPEITKPTAISPIATTLITSTDTLVKNKSSLSYSVKTMQEEKKY